MTERESIDDFHHIQTPLLEIAFWKELSEQSNIISTKTSAIKIYSILKNAFPAFQYLQKHNDDTDVDNNDHTVITAEEAHDNRSSKLSDAILQNKFHHQSFDFLDKHFTDGNCIETALYNIFQVVDESGNFVYSTSVCWLSFKTCPYFIVYPLFG